MEWSGVEWSGVEWTGEEWNGMEGMEWNEWNGEMVLARGKREKDGSEKARVIAHKKRAGFLIIELSNEI